MRCDRGKRVRNTLVTYPEVRDKLAKASLIPDGSEGTLSHPHLKVQIASGKAYGLSASWRGNGSPRLRRVAGLRDRPASLGLRHCPDSYGRLQSRIFPNGRKAEGATPRV